ncbi:MAG: hypothetical protein KUG79_16880 [Pseudomonadales bacterium]|nr:hypothetical protein [Pseudomonadales bacterium]
MSFDKLPLHDALLGQIKIDWENSLVKLELQAFTELSKAASPHHLLFQGVTDFRCSRNNEWGPSNSVLEVNNIDCEYQIQMQSGDTISIKADGYEFKQSGL